MKFFYRSALTVIVFLVFFSNILAQQRKFYGVIIDPAMREVNVPKGSIYENKVTLTNDYQSGEDKSYYPVAVNFRQHGETGEPELYIDNSLPDNANASKWVEFHEDIYNLKFGQRVDSNYTLHIPADAQPGGHYVALLYPNAKIEGETNVSLTEAIGSLLFITVQGDLVRTGELVEFKTGKKIYDFAPVDFQIRYKNNGNVHDVVGGNIFVYRKDITKPTAIMTVNKNTKLALPGSTRLYIDYLQYGFIRRDNNSKFKFRLDTKSFPKLMFGRYHATLKLKHYSNNQRITTERDVTFWVIPWELILILLIIIIGLSILIYRKFGKNRRKR